MPKIEILSGKREGDVVEFPDEEPLDIGNRKNAKLSLRDPWISWNHAKILREEGHWVIEDLGSSNGTFINGRKVTRQVLAPTDEILLGKTKIRIVEAGAVDGGSPAPEAFAAPAPGGRGDARLAAVERERDELRRMKEVLERFLDLSPEERLAAGAAAGAGQAPPGAPGEGGPDPRVAELEAQVGDLEAQLVEARATAAEASSRGDDGGHDAAASERARQEAVARAIELEGKASAAESKVYDLESRLSQAAENAKKELAKARQKLEGELNEAKLARADAEAARQKAEDRAAEAARKVETAAGDANARAEKLAAELASARKSAIDADSRAAKLERDLDAARRSTGRLGAGGGASSAEVDQLKADLAHARAERDDWKRRHDETREEIDRISMEQIELEDGLKERIASLEAELAKLKR